VVRLYAFGKSWQRFSVHRVYGRACMQTHGGLVEATCVTWMLWTPEATNERTNPISHYRYGYATNQTTNEPMNQCIQLS